MTEKMKTVCVGRFLLDVPAEATVSLSHERLAGFDIETIEESETAFQQRVAAREVAIRAQGDSAEQDGPGGMVEARELRLPDMAGRALVFGRERTYGFRGGRRVDVEWVSVEAHAHMKGLSITLSMEHAKEEKAREAEALLQQFRVRSRDEIPLVPGFCIADGIFLDPLPSHKREHVAIHVNLPNHPDLAIGLFIMPGGGDEPGLLSRIGDIDAKSPPDELLRVAKLRVGKRSINGLAGEEVLERIRELNFTTGYGFMWEMRGANDDPLQPYLLLQMETGTNPRSGGKPVDTSLHEDAVLALWESISSSVRLRPSGTPPGPTRSPEPPTPRLGTTVRAGNTCPQSGWWRCNEGGPRIEVQGGSVQYVRKGDRMPQALLLPQQTMWEKLRGIQPSVEPTLPTDWTLVDKRQRPRTPAVVALAQASPGEGMRTALASAADVVAVGTHVRTGEACPSSGWWRCEEVNALDGARWFAGGSILPVATFLVPRGLFGRATGPDVIQRRSTWQLMRHAEAESVATPTDAAFPLLDHPPAALDGASRSG